MAVFEQLVDGTNWKPSRQNEPPFGGFPGNWWMAPIGKMVVDGTNWKNGGSGRWWGRNWAVPNPEIPNKWLTILATFVSHTELKHSGAPHPSYQDPSYQKFFEIFHAPREPSRCMHGLSKRGTPWGLRKTFSSGMPVAFNRTFPDRNDRNCRANIALLRSLAYGKKRRIASKRFENLSPTQWIVTNPSRKSRQFPGRKEPLCNLKIAKTARFPRSVC